MSHVISYESNPNSDAVQILGNGITANAKLKKNQPPIEFFAYLVKDDNGKILGGCNGSMYYGCIYIDQLWVDESLRGKGYGKQLMQAAEALARDKKCLLSTLNTMDWEALDFYKKLGYYVEFERAGYMNDSTLYLLRKDL